MINALPVAVHVEQPCEDEEDEGREDSNEDPNRLLGMEICNQPTRASIQLTVLHCLIASFYG